MVRSPSIPSASWEDFRRRRWTLTRCETLPVGPPSPRKVGKAAGSKAAPVKRGSKARAGSDDEVDAREARRQRLSKPAVGIPAVAVAAAGLAFNAYPDGHIFNQLCGDDNADDHEAVPTSDSGNNKGKGKAAAAPKEAKSREYIPRQNSGAYAILLALYKNASFDERETWVTKQRIMDDGQEYSSTPFETGTANRGGQAQSGQGFTYSAWSGMKTREEPTIKLDNTDLSQADPGSLQLRTVTSKDLAVTDNKRPAKFALTAAGYALAERLAPSAGLEVHVRLPSSSYGSHDGGHPSSSGPRASGSADRPDRVGIRSSAGGRTGLQRAGDEDEAYSPGLGNALGVSTSGPSVLRNTSVHVAAPRRRQVTPDLFGDDPDRPRPGLVATASVDEAQCLKQLRLATELSKKDAVRTAPDEHFGVSTTGTMTDVAFVARSASGSAVLNARKAAMGVLAAAPPTRSNNTPTTRNVGACPVPTVWVPSLLRKADRHTCRYGVRVLLLDGRCASTVPTDIPMRDQQKKLIDLESCRQ